MTNRLTIWGGGKRTSVSLEDVFCEHLKEVARSEGVTPRLVIERVMATNPPNLTSALRCHLMRHAIREAEIARAEAAAAQGRPA